MAVEFMDGWEGGGLELWSTTSGATVITARASMSGNYCLNLSTSTWYVQRSITADDEYYWSMRCEFTQSAYNITVITFYFGSTIICQLRKVITTSYLAAYVGTSVVETATTIPLSVGQVYLIEGYIKIADVSGRFVVKVDGTTVIDFTGDTKPGADTQVNTVRIGCETTRYSYMYVDDFILDHDGYLGSLRIAGIVPSAAGTTTGWTPSAGSNWDCVDERPANDTDYVSVNTVDAIDLYTASNLGFTPSSIKAVQLHARGAYEGAPSVAHVQLALRTYATNYFSADKSPPSSFGLIGYHVWDTNPNTLAAWSGTEVDALEIGVKATT